jgi:enoyl-CoA hydratase/carnithine racemase
VIGTVATVREGPVLRIALDRVPKRNAFDIPMYEALSLALGQLERDPDLRCGVLVAHGDHFTGGIDLPQWTPFYRQGEAPPLPDGGLDPLGQTPGRILSKPLIAAVRGYCLTIGIELLLAADIRIAAADTRFAQIEVKRGIFPVGGATIRFAQEAGWGNAMRWLLTGDEFDAAEALRIGLVQEVVPTGTETARAMSIAGTICAQAPLAVSATLASGRDARIDGEQAAIARLLPALTRLLDTEDAQEGMAAFRERRPGRFTGR